MLKTIEQLNYCVVNLEKMLYEEVIKLDNHMNNCDCDECSRYDFSNCVGADTGELHIFCLNCGGYVEPME